MSLNQLALKITLSLSEILDPSEVKFKDQMIKEHSEFCLIGAIL